MLISLSRCCEQAMDAWRAVPARAFPGQGVQRSRINQGRRALSQQPETGRFEPIPLSRDACSERHGGAARIPNRPRGGLEMSVDTP